MSKNWREKLPRRELTNSEHAYEPAHPEMLIAIREQSEQLDKQSKELVALAIRILVDLTPAQALVSYLFFYRYPSLFQPLEEKIDLFTKRNTHHWYLYIMGSFIKTIIHNLAAPHPTIQEIDHNLSSSSQFYDAHPVLIKEIASTQKTLFSDSLTPFIQNLIVSWITTINGIPLTFDKSTIELIMSHPQVRRCYDIKNDLSSPWLSRQGLNERAPFQQIILQARDLATALGARASMRIYFLIHNAVVQTTMQLLLHFSIIPLANQLLAFFGKNLSTLPYSKDQAEIKLSSLKQRKFIQHIIRGLCYFYFFYRAYIVAQRLLAIPTAVRLKNLDILAINSLKNTELAALGTIISIIYQFILSKISSYHKPAAGLKALEKLNAATANITKDHNVLWKMAFLGTYEQSIIVFDLSTLSFSSNTENLNKQDIITLIANACIKNHLGFLYISNNQIAIRDELLSDNHYQQFSFTVEAYLQRYQQLQTLHANISAIRNELTKRSILVNKQDNMLMDKESTSDGNVQWRICFTIHPKYKQSVNTEFTNVKIQETFASLFSGYVVSINAQKGAIIIQGFQSFTFDRATVNQLIQLLASQLEANAPVTSTNFAAEHQASEALFRVKKCNKKKARQPFSADSDQAPATVNENSDNDSIFFDSQHIYNSQDRTCSIKPLDLPWVQGVYFVCISKALRESPHGALLTALLQHPHFVPSQGHQGITTNTLQDNDGFTSPFKIKLFGEQGRGDTRVTCSRSGFFRTSTGKILLEFNTISSHRDLTLASR